MRKIKVLHILHSFGIGGLEKGIAMLTNHSSPDFEHIILCLTQSGDSRTLIPAEVKIYEMHKQPGNSVRFLWQMSRTIQRIKPDLVHTRNWSGIDGIIAARLAGVRGIIHGEHGWGMDDPLGSRQKRKLVRRWLTLGVVEFTAVSQQIKGWLEEEVRIFRPVTQIYNGVELPPAHALPVTGGLRQELGLSDSELLVGTVGRLDPIKDQAGLINSFQEVRKQVPSSHLVLVGDGPERENLQKLQTDGVHLLGMRNDVAALLRQLDLFVLPSLNEGISNTILEAMAAGLPVVATAVGGTPELIRHEENGLLVAARDYHALNQTLLRYLLSPQLRVSHGNRGRSIVSKNFSIPAMVAGYEAVWSRVAENTGFSL